MELQKEQKDGFPLPVYLIKTTSDHTLDKIWKLFLRSVVPSRFRRHKAERFQAEDIEPGLLIQKLRNLSLFGGRQLVMVRRIEQWNKESRGLLLHYVAHPNPNSCLILTVDPRKSWKKLEKTVAQTGRIIQPRALRDKDIPRWVVNHCRQLGKAMDLKAATTLVRIAGSDLQVVENELTKIVLYVGSREVITEEDVELVACAKLDHHVFTLMDWVIQRRTAESLRVLHQLLRAGESPLSILALLARQVRITWQVKDGHDQGLDEQQLARKLRLPPFVVRSHLRQALKMTTAELKRMHHRLRSADIATKTTGIRPEAVLDDLVFQLCEIDQESP